MPAVSILIKPASSACNIRCHYCFYRSLSECRQEANYGRMKEDTLKNLVQEAILYAQGDGSGDRFVNFAFQGGEPMLSGLFFYREAVRLQEEYNTYGVMVQNTIQTNGTLMDEEWLDFFRENHFLVGLSLDGARGLHDGCRVDKEEKGTFSRVIESARLLQKKEVDFNIISVVTAKAIEKAGQIYRFFRKEGFDFLQFIPCMEELPEELGKGDTPSDYALTKAGKEVRTSDGKPGYGFFLTELFDIWYEEYSHGGDVDIRFFSNLAQMAAGYPPETCGMCGKCSCYFVVEADGSVYPCDFYAADRWKLGNVMDGFAGLYQSRKAREFEQQSYPMYEKCQTCPYEWLCHGGCRRWREPFKEGRPGLNSLCESYQYFFSHCEERIKKLADLIRRHMAG